MATPEQITIITNLSRYGHTQFYISGILGISKSTLSLWKQENPEVANALNVSQEGLLLDVKSKMYQNAMSNDLKASNTAGQFLLNRYEQDEAVGSEDEVSDDELARGIADDLKA